MKRFLSILALLVVGHAAYADTAASDLVLKCTNGTVGASVAPWVSNCPTANQSFAVPTDADIVAVDSKTGTWQRFGDVIATRLVRACLKGSTFTGANCSGDGVTSGAVFKAKGALVAPAQPPPDIDTDATAKLTWSAPTTNTDGTPLADLKGYNIYQSASSTSLVAGSAPPASAKIGTTEGLTYSVSNLPLEIPQYFGVTAFNAAGVESVLSPILSKTVSAPLTPTVTISCTPTDGIESVTASCSWSATNATACTASGGWSGSKALTGTEIQPAIKASVTYTLTCAGPGGSSVVNVPVIVSPRPGVVSGFQVQ